MMQYQDEIIRTFHNSERNILPKLLIKFDTSVWTPEKTKICTGLIRNQGMRPNNA